MNTYRIFSIAIIATIALLGYFISSGLQEGSTTNFPFDYGLDLAGGTLLTYEADISEVDPVDIHGSIEALRNVLESRLNALGTSDIKVTTEAASIFSENSEESYRVNVEIPGVFDAEEAKSLIGKIPLLEFRMANSIEEIDKQVALIAKEQGVTEEEILENISPYIIYGATELTGRYVENATLGTSQYANQHTVLLQFDSDGARIFSDLTRDNVGNVMAIFLDGEVISDPVINQAIPGGTAEISGNFTQEEAQSLVRDLKFGALPVPIDLISTQSISPSLGGDIITKGVTAGLWTFAIVSIFLLFLYRLGGVIAVVALSFYVLLLLAFFKLTGVDLTAAGIAGLVITIGMAVDANILIFERIKEELRDKAKDTTQAITDGFDRAWLSIRDGNLSSVITALVLYFLTTSFIKGFALTFGIGVLVSMFTAITVTRTLLLAVVSEKAWLRTILVGSIK